MTSRIENLPDELCSPPGMIGSLVDHMRRTAEYDLPELFLQTALSVVAVVTSRKLVDYRGTCPNLLSVGLSPSGSGKEHGRRIAKRLLSDSALLGAESFTSGAAIMRSLEQRPAMMALVDEAGMWLSAAMNDRSPAHMRQIVDVLLRSYTASDSLWQAVAYGDQSMNIEIDRPHMTVCATTTPGSLFDGLSESQVGNGLVGRILFFCSPGLGYVRRQAHSAEAVPDDIVDFVRKWVDHAPGGNLGGINPFPDVIGISDEARARINQHFDDISEKRIGEEALAAAIWSRAAEKTSKLAMLQAVARGSATIELKDTDWAIAVVNFLTRRLIRLVRGNVAHSQHERHVQLALRFVRESGGVVSRSALTKKLQRINRRDRDELIRQLLDDGDLLFCTKASATRTAEGYALTLADARRHGWDWQTPELLEDEIRQYRQAQSGESIKTSCRNIPEELRSQKIWMFWQNEDGRKIPYRTGGDRGSSSDPKSWSSFDTVIRQHDLYTGICLVINDPYTGVDLDSCLNPDGSLVDWAIPILQKFDGLAYAEISPSGKGIKLLTRGRKPDWAKSVQSMGTGRQQIEIYDYGRAWCMTGDVWNGQRSISDGQQAVWNLCHQFWAPEKPQEKPQASLGSIGAHSSLTLRERAEKYVQRAGNEAQGNRNNKAYSLADGIRRTIVDDNTGERITESVILDVMRLWNSSNSPALPDDELVSAVGSSARTGRNGGRKNHR